MSRCRKPIILAAEGFTYFALSLIDALVHIIPKVGDSLQIFRPLDIFIGTASFVPLLLYTLFLLLYTNSELFLIISAQFRAIVMYSLLFVIPVIIALNGLASFFGISYPPSGTFGVQHMVAVGFTNNSAHTVFDIVTLALLVLYQGIHLCVALHRLNKAFRQRRSEATPDGIQVKTHLFHGLLWIIAGFLLGTVEVLVGFASGGYAVVLTRRILRLLGRACLIIGVINGVDRVEDFHIFRSADVQSRRRSTLRTLISNPRNSTFVHLSGHAFDPEAAPGSPTPTQMVEAKVFAFHVPGEKTARSSWLRPNRASVHSRPPSSAPFLQRTINLDRPARAALRPRFTDIDERRQKRVTVHYTTDDTPVLQLRRFSSLSLHKALLNTESFREHTLPRSKSLPPDFEGLKSLTSPVAPVPPLTFEAEAIPDSPPATATTVSTIEPAVIVTAKRAYSARSRQTIAGGHYLMEQERDSCGSDSMEAVHALAVQFPCTPPRTATQHPNEELNYQVPLWRAAYERNPNFSATGKIRGRVTPDPGVEMLTVTDDGATSIPISRQSSTHPTSRCWRSTLRQDLLEQRMLRRASIENALIVDTVLQGETMDPESLEASLPTPMSMNAVPLSGTPSQSYADTGLRTAKTLSADTTGAITSSSIASDEAELPGGTAMRIKSVGNVPRRMTPDPYVAFTRESIAVEVDITSAERQRGANAVVDPYTPTPIKVRRKLHRQSKVGEKQHERLGVARWVS
ncbi:predicted protein [Sparassis crispa]|uniref:Uncharacterized protein n=1 Tax=Sparassis crispa TaxID=139825 RepID=A0A401H5R6_9APHY|nr:predicted protein [Sparassis crispa]GBE89786.1 predicted protein [Sparassis crispa]